VRELKRTKFLALREEIRKKRQSSQEQRFYEIGRKRQDKISFFLQELKEGGIIRDFLQTDDLSFQDIVEGIDFFIVYIDGAKYKTCPLSVTGERWVEKHRNQHPEIPVVTVNFFDTSVSIKSKIMEVIKIKNKSS